MIIVDGKVTTKMDLTGEERFGWVTSRLYNLFAKRGAFGVYEFASRDILKSGKAIKVLDVGTGPGNLPSMLSAKSRKLRIWAIDPSPSMLSIAKRKTGNSQVRFAIGYSQHVPFKEKFDIIASSISFHHWAHKKESLIYLSRFLKKGGEIRVYEMRKSGRRILGHFSEMHRRSEEELRRAADGSGLRVKEIVEHGRLIRATYVMR